MTDDKGSPALDTRVTIVVPVYGDWISLRDCITSLIENASPAVYDTLLINDCGPDADELEAGIRGLIAGHSTFRYVRNPQNLGFVGTCNRAVYELDCSDNDVLLLNSDTTVTAGALDEMRSVLALNDGYGVVCPRSNDATIATIPFFRRESTAPRSAERSRAVFDAVAPRLPRFYISPVSVGFCLLIRRSLIREFGLFDPVFGIGYSEENDLCLRLNSHGISSLIANHAFVYHVGSSSFGSEQRASLDEKNSRVVRERYPHYPASVVSFVHHDYHPIDRFADLLVSESDEPASAILISIDLEADCSPTTASELAARLAAILDAVPKGTTVTIASRVPTLHGVILDTTKVTVVDPSHVDSLFDLGISLSLTATTEQLVLLNRHCLRWLIVGAEPSRLTSWAARASEPQLPVVAALALLHADAVVWESMTGLQRAQSVMGPSNTVSRTAVEEPETRSEWQKLMSAVLTRPAQFGALISRDSAIRPLSVVTEASQQTAKTHMLRELHASRTYRLAQQLASLARLPRTLLRRS